MSRARYPKIRGAGEADNTHKEGSLTTSGSSPADAWTMPDMSSARRARPITTAWGDDSMPAAKNRNRAFSLIELVIVVVIIGIIAAIAIPRMSRGATGAAENSL